MNATSAILPTVIPIRQMLGRLMEIPRQSVRIWLESHAFDHAASISFFALLSVAPFLILVVSAAGYVAVLMGPASELMEGMIREVTAFLQKWTPVEGDTVRDIVKKLVRRRGQFGIFGGLVMLFGASMVFGALEHAMSDIFALRKRRRFLVSRAIFSVVLIATGSFIFLLHYAMTLADSFLLAREGHTLVQWLRHSEAVDMIVTYLPVPLGFLASLYAPGIVRARITHALVGAAVFFVLWEVARNGYAWYVTSLAEFGVLYGSLATPMLLILWMFYSANILLFAMACVSALDRQSKKTLHST